MTLREVDGHQFSKEFLDSFKVIEQIGSGFSGTVVLAKQLSLNRKVAIKLLNPHTSERETLSKRFLREARILSELSHPNIINVYDYGFDGNVPYLVQEYLQGETLQERMDRENRFTLRASIKLISHLAAGLAHAHKAAVLHRDVKPANVFLTDDGRIVLLDFGLAISDDYCTILTQSGYTVGTPIYMAPEQMQSSNVTAAADIYSTGMVFYRLIANDFPFQVLDNDYYELKLSGQIKKLSDEFSHLPKELTALVDNTLALRDNERPRDGMALLNELRRLPKAAFKDEPIEAATEDDVLPHPVPSMPPRKVRKTGKEKSKVWRGLLAFLPIAAIITYIIYGRQNLLPMPSAKVREFSIKELHSTEITLLVKANPSCRATIFVYMDEQLLAKKNVVAKPEGNEVRLSVPSATAFQLKALFAARPKPIVRQIRTMTPDLTLTPLLDKEHLEKEKNVPRSLARSLGRDKVSLACSPALWEDSLVLGTRKHGLFCWSVRREQILWYQKEAPKFYRMTASSAGVFCNTHDGFVYAFSLQTGKVLWQRELGGQLEGGPFVYDSLLLVRRKAKNGAILALHAEKGTLAWQRLNESFSQPWSITSDGIVFVPEILGPIKCFQAKTGESLPSPKAFLAGRLSTPVISMGETLYAGLDTGLIVAGTLRGNRTMSVKIIGEPRYMIDHNDNLYVACSTPHHIVAISTKERRAIWEHELSNTALENLFICNENLVVHETPKDLETALHILDCTSGTLLAHLKSSGKLYCRSVALPDGLLLLSNRATLIRVVLHGAR